MYLSVTTIKQWAVQRPRLTYGRLVTVDIDKTYRVQPYCNPIDLTLNDPRIKFKVTTLKSQKYETLEDHQRVLCILHVYRW